MKYRLQKIILSLFILPGILLPRVSYAQDISIEASVNTNRVALGSSIQLTITINGIRDSAELKLPAISDIELRYLGPSTRMSLTNGQYSSSVAHIYTLIPLKTGKVQIPALTTTISGKTYSTNAIDIEIVDKGASPGTQQDQATSQSLSLEDKAFLTIETSKTRLYLNEKSLLTLKLYISDVSLRDIQYPDFSQIGFTAEQFQEPGQYKENVGGKLYEIVEFKTFIYPTRTGKLEIGPASIKSNILIRSAERQRRFGGGNFFDDNFMGGFLGQHQKHPISLESNDLIIDVLPLPAEGKPDNFSGAVGKFDFESTASPLEVKVGDPATLKMTLSGTGNMKGAIMPTLQAGEDFKLYDPQIKEEGGVKTLEQVVIPKSDKVKEIPAIEFSYFDVEENKYKTITRGPFPLKVIKTDEQEQFKIIEFDNEKKAIVQETLGRDIIFIKEQPGDFRKKNSRLYLNPWFVTLVISSFLIWLVILVNYRRTHKLKTDVVYARRLRAPKQAKKGLSEARQLLEQKQQKEFYNSIFKTLQGYFGNKFHLAPGAVTIETVKNRLNSHAIETELLKNIESIFAECDLIRYASVDTDENKMRDNYKKTEEIIDYLERHVK